MRVKYKNCINKVALKKKKTVVDQQTKNPTPSASLKSTILHKDQNDYLRQARTTKKEKRETKSIEFQQRIFGQNKISKSTARRNKRRAKSNLKGNLDGLLASLPEESLETGYIGPVKAPINPKTSSKNNEKVIRHEKERFNQILAEKTFQASPFSTLKNFISTNMERKKEFKDFQEKSAIHMKE